MGNSTEREIMMNLKHLVVLVLIGLLTTACSSTTVKNSWVKPDYTNKLENVFLIGIAKEEEYRRLFEEALRRQLTDQGIRAVSSYNHLPKNQEDSKANIIKTMTANGCDSVLLTKLVRKRTDEGTKGPDIKVVNASPVPLYLDPWYNNWGGYYNQSYSVTNIQPTTPGSVTLTIESVLYDLKTEEMIWSARLETVKEIDVMKMIRDYVDAVTRDLTKNDLI